MATELEPRIMGGAITGTVDPTGGKNYLIGKVPTACKGRLLKVYMVTATGKVAHASNGVTVALNRYRAGSATSIGSQSTLTGVSGYVAITAYTPWEVLLTSAALSELNASDVIMATVTEGAAGQDLTEVSFFAEWVPGTGTGQ